MSGTKSQQDPSLMFRDWIQKSGRAQAEFARGFGALMAGGSFDPLGTLREVSEGARRAQAGVMEGMSSVQSRGLEAAFGMGQLLPSFANWGAYKTTVSSNGRISIPEAERSALGIGEGDLVQVVIVPIGRRSRGVKE